MRIEKLEVSGLRSHRGNPPTSVALTGKRLVAVVGHTGAGKSSLLEAITFALFGEATYGGRAYEELSSDGRSEMTVQLTFSRGDERYLLLRTVAPNRSGKFGNKVVYLRQVDDAGGTLSHTEGVREVDKKVSGLLGGMTREQFCQAVLLAQNRFADLLEANPADRERLLDTLLGLSALTEARAALQKTRSAAARNIERLESRREALPADPPAEARAAKARSKVMAGISKRAEQAGSNLESVAKEAADLSRQAVDLERAATLRTTDRGPTGGERLAAVAATVGSLAQLDAELAATETQTATELDGASRTCTEAAEAVTRAEAAHGAAGRHQVVAQQLATLADLLGEKPGLVEAVAKAEAELQRLGAEKVAAEEQAATATAALEQRRQAHVEAEEAARQAAAAVDAAVGALAAASGAVGRFTEKVAEVGQARQGLDGARGELAAATTALAPLAERQAAADAALEAAIRSDSAAAASHGCHPGDDCPVCGRALPEVWHAPPAVDLDAARTAAAGAQDAVRGATDRLQRAREEEVAARTGLRSALAAAAGAQEDIATVSAERGLPSLPAPARPLHLDDDAAEEAVGGVVEAAEGLETALGQWLEVLGQRLGPLEETKKSADSRLAETATKLTEATAAKTAADDALGQARTALATAETQYTSAVAAVESCEKRLAQTVSGIDERWRALVDLDAPASLETATQRLADDQSAVAAVVTAQKEADAAVETLERQSGELAARRAREVTAPLAGVRADLRNLTELVNDLGERLELSGVPAVAEDAGADALLAAASALDNAVDRATTAAAERCASMRADVAALAAPAAEVVEALVTLMAEADPDGTAFGVVLDPGDPLSEGTRQLVQRVVGGARQMATEASEKAAAAGAAVKTAKELDQRLGRLRAWAADLDGAIEVLKKERFPRWARGLKMGDLVDTASEHLSEMTDSRFRFDPSLQISDEVAGVVRKASTLSGGEKFEAALALALGVSEIAGRSGVRIETLFLDEGFAGLDQAHLNRALDALEREVAAGRSIVLITHIGAVADRIEDVLLIQPDGAGGSTTKWLDEDERFELGADLDLAVP